MKTYYMDEYTYYIYTIDDYIIHTIQCLYAHNIHIVYIATLYSYIATYVTGFEKGTDASKFSTLNVCSLYNSACLPYKAVIS